MKNNEFSYNYGSMMDPGFDPLVREIIPQARLLRAWQLSGGISAGMTALEVALPKGQTQKWIVRRPNPLALQRNPLAARDEFNLLQITHSQGLPTPAPIYLDEMGMYLSSPCLVLEYIEGQLVFSLSDLDNTISQLAKQFARIHTVPWSSLESVFLGKPAMGLSHFVTKRPAVENRSLDEARIRNTVEAAWPFPQRNPSGLLHGDYWPGNVLWQAGRLAAVIDWEDAGYGDPLIDLAISRLDILWIFGREAMHAFTRQYCANMAVDLTNLPLWDLCAALRLIRLAGSNLVEWAAFFLPYGRSDITELTIRQHFHYFIELAFEKL
jgi:aminoglycoside phosphotransferase (APT) family kinase protein